jgi:hypothetical protein
MPYESVKSNLSFLSMILNIEQKKMLKTREKERERGGGEREREREREREGGEGV